MNIGNINEFEKIRQEQIIKGSNPSVIRGISDQEAQLLYWKQRKFW